jgi:hypothetical protein
MLLMIDNYDSFTYNLVQYFNQLGQEVEVHRNDLISLDDIEKKSPKKIVISPGPCTPDNFSPKSSPNRLMPETNTQQWNFSGKVFDHRNGDPGLIRCARPWRDNNFFWIQGLYFLNRYLVVAFYQHISTQLPHVLHDVVGKRVVIIDHQQHL